VTISVLIPSFQRPHRLTACLQALAKQSVLPTQVLVVWQAEDVQTRDAAEELIARLPFRLDVLHSPEAGVVPAENLALDRAVGEIIALIDDDAVPPVDWIERHLRFYADPGVGAVGGPADNYYQDGKLFTRLDRTPHGKLMWYGKLFGNMHTQPVEWRTRTPVEVDHLVGYNFSLRRVAFDRFETGLRRYWQLFELDACLQAKARGFRMMFDFGNVVDHHPTNSAYAGGRDGDLEVKVYNAAFNVAFVLSKHTPLGLRILRLSYLLAIGSVATPGLLAALVAWRRYGNARRELSILTRSWGSMIAGWRAGSRRRNAVIRS